MNPKKLALGAASVLAAGAIIGGGAALASADPTPSASASASGASADSGSASGTAGQGRQMGGTHTDVTGDEAQKVIDAVKAKDSSATIDTVRKDPDGSYDALGTTSDGAKVMFDVSADLLELAQTPVAVVCAGAKAILDLPLTLEVLETHGVPVVGYRCANFPAFYTRDSGLPLDIRCVSFEEIAAILRSRETLGFKTGTLVATPVPAEHELPAEVAEKAIAQALEEAEDRDVRGKYVTPFLLARVSELTHEESRTANVALLQNNARVAAQIAGALAAS